MFGGGGGDDGSGQMIADEEAESARVQAEKKSDDLRTEKNEISAIRGSASGFGGGKTSLGG